MVSPFAIVFEVGEIPEIIIFIIMIGADHKSHCAGREVDKTAPDSGTYQNTLIGLVEEECFLFHPIVKNERETSADCYYEFEKFFMGMISAAFAPRDIIGEIYTLDFKRYVESSFNYREITSGILEARKFYQFYIHCLRN